MYNCICILLFGDVDSELPMATALMFGLPATVGRAYTTLVFSESITLDIYSILHLHSGNPLWRHRIPVATVTSLEEWWYSQAQRLT